MNNIRILITCSSIIKKLKSYESMFKKYNITYTYLDSTYPLNENELLKFVPNYDVWIVENDQVTHNILYEGKKGKLKFLIKFGNNTNNIDISACNELNIRFEYTQHVFGEDISDVAIGYLLMLNRKLHEIDSKIKNNIWHKPTGSSLYGKKVCVIGFNNIGKCIVKKLFPFSMNIFVCDSEYEHLVTKDKILDKTRRKLLANIHNITIAKLNECMINADYVIVACDDNYAINKDFLLLCKKGVKIINTCAKNTIKEIDLIELLKSKHIDSIAFDVFQTEPLPPNSELRLFSQNIFGSHNAMNTEESVDKAIFFIMDKIASYFNIHPKSNL